MASYLDEPWARLKERLQARGIGAAELRRAVRVLAGPDPAGVLLPVRRSDVAKVAAHMNPRRGRYTEWSPEWELIPGGHPAARAIYCHELVEIAELGRQGEEDPDSLDRAGAKYFVAHAAACWDEARYWAGWAWAENQRIPPEAFLYAHPWRTVDEVRGVVRELLAWGVSVSNPGRVELARARAFYAARGVVPR